MSIASLDGVVGPAGEVSIPVADDGLLRGDGAFETVRLYGGRAFALREHLDRLAHSAERLRLPVDLAAVRADVAAVLEAWGSGDGALRIVFTRGGRRIVLAEPLADRPAAVALQSVTYAPSRVLDGVKSLSYAANMLARRLAREAGADDALLVTPHGRVLEAPTASFFWVSGGRVCTPPLSDRILSSITRGCVAGALDVVERECTLEDALGAEEAFLASTVAEITPVRAIDGRELDAPGAVTQQARAALRACVERELAGGEAS